MAEPATHGASLVLYRYMCQKILGTEEHVKTIRMMDTVRDNFSINDNNAILTSGMFEEELKKERQNVYPMIAMKYFEVYENMAVPFNPKNICCIMDTDETQPGFTKLRLTNCDTFKVLELCDKIEGKYYLSSININQLYLRNFPIINGVRVSNEKGFLNIQYCLHSQSWISQAQQWITRSSHAWPGYDVKQSIIKHGILFVPKGVQGSIREELEWRISFSVGETFLINTFTHTQLVCYSLMKILLKDVIDNDPSCKHLLCSYFIKTILFWISEECHPTIWIPANLISNFMRCLRRLIYCVEYSVCQHYFIPESNLFENKIKGRAQETLLKKINTINSYGWQCLFFSDRIPYINELEFQVYNEANLLYVDSLNLILYQSIFLTYCFIPSEYHSWGKGIHLILSTESSKIKHLCAYFMSKICHNSNHLLAISDNKSAYKQYKMCISTMLLNTSHDTVSGWLRVASFFYNTKQYKIALVILQHSLLKCSSEKLYHGFNLSNIHYEIFSLRLFRNMTIGQMCKLLLVDKVRFIENFTLSPVELQIKEYTTPNVIPPVVYAHFLRFLCHYHLNNIVQCQHSLQLINLTIVKKYFIADTYERAMSYNILGIGFQLVGDIKSAKHAFLKSIELESDPYLNSADRRLSLLGLI